MILGMNKQDFSVVFIPGFMLDESLWDDVVQMLPAHFNVYKVSLQQGNTIEEIAEHIVKNLPSQFVLVGFSLGGYVARSIVRLFPDKVSALVLIASSLRTDTEEQKNRKLTAIKLTSKEHFKGLSSKVISKTLHPTQEKNNILIQRIQKMGKQMGYDSFVTQSLLNRDDYESSRIKCPTLIISGEQDTIRSYEEGIELFNEIPCSTFEVIENTGHMIPLEQPLKLSTSILKWLNTIDL